MELFSRRRWATGSVQHVQHNSFWVCHKHNSLLLGPIQPSSPSANEHHNLWLLVTPNLCSKLKGKYYGLLLLGPALIIHKIRYRILSQKLAADSQTDSRGILPTSIEDWFAVNNALHNFAYSLVSQFFAYFKSQAMWTYAGIDCGQILSKICPKSGWSIFTKKLPVFQNSPKIALCLGQFCYRNISKIAQSGHTGPRFQHLDYN